MNQSFFLRTFFHSALAILEPQIYIVVDQVAVENISLLSQFLTYLFQLQSTLHCSLSTKGSFLLATGKKTFRAQKAHSLIFDIVRF